jgi:lysophospholipase
MGGNIVLNYLLKRSEKDYDRAVIETPWFRLYKNQTPLMVFLAKPLGFLSPGFAVKNDLVTDAISRDPKKVEALKNDKLYHNRMGLRIFTQISASGEYIMKNADKLTLPILLLSGEDDRIVCPKAIREWSGKAGGNVTFYEEPKGRHALHDESEPTRSEILKRILNFMEV